MSKFWKLSVLCSFIIALNGCSNTDETIKKYGLTDVQSCDREDVLQANKDGIIKDKGKVYCELKSNQHLDQVNMFVKAGYDAKRIDQFLTLFYYQEDKTNRYIAYDNKNKKVEDVVTFVNIGLDLPLYTHIKTIRDTDDIRMLINKYHRLPANYKPKNLVKTAQPCVIGEDYSCQSETQYLVKEAAEAFVKLTDAAKKEQIKLKAIASYRSYEYQNSLYEYYKNEQGEEYADTYYARPGQSEHNTGLAVDVMLDDIPFNEIDQSMHYQWLLDRMQDYGFILRYPKDKEAITGYQYESWHLRYVGIDTAKAIKKDNLTLDEYIARGGA